MSIENPISIIDNFLVEEEFVALRDTIDDFDFPWHYNPTVLHEGAEGPGFFYHIVYGEDIPHSPYFYNSLRHIVKKLNIVILARIRVNLNPRLPEPYFSDFHTDIRNEDMEKSIASLWTTSILYINTNNGYTELETGDKIESVANRLVSFPLSTKHRFVTQTDTQIRLLINFGYLKRSTYII